MILKKYCHKFFQLNEIYSQIQLKIWLVFIFWTVRAF